ncbi:MAG: hypothetical protein V3V99_10590 [candidate division Zixibacteria bacterium]
MGNNDDKTQSHIILTKGMMVGHYRIVEKIGAGVIGHFNDGGVDCLNSLSIF